MTKKAEDLYKKAIAEFGPDALSCDSSRGFNLTSIKAQFVRERLNAVFGLMNWTLTGEYREVAGGIIYLGNLTVTVDGETNTHEAPGYSATKKNMGDAYKGAQTDSLCKCASNFGVGNEVFKGNVKPPTGGAPAPRKTKSTAKTATAEWAPKRAGRW